MSAQPRERSMLRTNSKFESSATFLLLVSRRCREYASAGSISLARTSVGDRFGRIRRSQTQRGSLRIGARCRAKSSCYPL